MLFFAALVPLRLYTGVEPAGLAVASHVYVRFDSPPSSAPSTLNALLVPVTVDGDADAAVATVGAALVIVTLAVPLIPPLDAWTVAVPAAPGAVYNPVPLIDPIPDVLLQANPGWLDNAMPNWSLATALNCWLPFSFRPAVPGATAMLVSVWLTVTLTELLTLLVPSLIVTVNV